MACFASKFCAFYSLPTWGLQLLVVVVIVVLSEAAILSTEATTIGRGRSEEAVAARSLVVPWFVVSNTTVARTSTVAALSSFVLRQSKEGLWRVREKVQRGCYCRPLPFEWWRRPLSFSSSCDSHSDCCWLEAARDHVWGRLFGLLLLLTILKAKGWISLWQYCLFFSFWPTAFTFTIARNSFVCDLS